MGRTIEVRNGKVDDAIRIFKRNNADVSKKVREKEHHEKPGEKRRKAKKEGIKNTRKRERRYN